AEEYRSLLAVPVNGNDMVRAVISMESYHGFHFKDQHKKILETMAYQIAALLEKIDVLEKFSEQNVFDSGTGLGNLKALQIELDKEVERSKEFQKKFTLLLVKLNIQSKHPGNEVVDKVVSEFITFALPHFPSSSNFYRISDNTIGIIMAEKILRDVLPKAKEICDKVSLKKIWGAGLVDNFSINCGLVQCPEMGVDSSELIEKAQKAVLKAEHQGVNQSALYERSEGSSE
ncbi:MAG: diguanylate cyclase domain-containing protein, partial [Calditrichia bacterium]